MDAARHSAFQVAVALAFPVRAVTVGSPTMPSEATRAGSGVDAAAATL